ncbi:DUF1667 domain-containing protein [Clostridium hydrogeniformans]|uniref:DUF1667 domain-containing protein n=1 Tax=Clostridium hydrogeniformans TaxID=349933 RepID=UPI0004800B76|nr:DUF1667 domain-containing protein [Clostridium hydrogeniformans]
MYKASICEGCHKSCVIHIYKDKDDIDIYGNECEVGLEYGKFKSKEDKEIFTTIIRIKGSEKHKVLPVKSSQEIDRSLWIECSKALSRIYVGPPISLGDIICKNILNTGVDIISCRTIERDKRV